MNIHSQPSDKQTSKQAISQRLDSLLVHRFWGYPIFILVIFLMFQATFVLGEYPMQWIEAGVQWIHDTLSTSMNPGPLKDMLLDGIIGGVGGVIVFLPNIVILYLCIGFLEESGYMARASQLMDDFMGKLGMHGRSFIPLIMGFGCNVPAILTTKQIPSRNARMITILINPLMSCSARLPVYILLAGAFFPEHAGLALFCIYTLGVTVAILAALVFKHTLFKREKAAFTIKLPNYHFPSLKKMASITWEKSQQYLRKMGSVILVGSIIIWALGYFPRTFNDLPESELTPEQRIEQQSNSYIGQIGRFIEPVIKPLGFDWKIGVSLLSGVAAKEIIVSTLGVLYTGDYNEDTASLTHRLQSETLSDGSPAFTPQVAMSLMAFVLLYFPCFATVTAIKNETNSWGWALFTVGYTMVLAWTVAWLIAII